VNVVRALKICHSSQSWKWPCCICSSCRNYCYITLLLVLHSGH